MILPRRSTQAGGTPGFGAEGVALPENLAARQAQQFGAGLERAGAAAFDVANELQQEYNTARIKEADNRAADAFRDVIGRYRQTEGKDARLAKERVFEELQERLQAIGEPLDTDDQRIAFQARVDDRMVQARGIADAHEAQQIRADAVGQADARKKSEMLDAVNAAGDPLQFAYHRGVMLTEVDNLADLAGMAKDDPRRELAKRQELTDLHNQAVRSLINQGRTQVAAQQLAAHGAEIDAPARAQLQGLVQQAQVDDQSFGAARWSRGQGGTLVDQIERLNQFVEGGELSVQVLDAAEARLRSMERTEWESTARTGNEALQQAESFATLNRVGAYDELPLPLRESLETTGRDVHIKAWLAQGRQRVTTPRGIDLMLGASDEFLLSVSRDTLEAAAATQLSVSDGRSLLNEWDRVHGAAAAAGAGGGLTEGLINMTVNRKLQQLGYLDPEEATTEGQRNRRDWVLERVRRDVRANPQRDPDQVIDAVLAETLTVGGDTKPLDWWTPQERQDGVYVTPVQEVPRSQVSPDLVARRLQENRARNEARRRWLQSQPPGAAAPRMLPEDTPGIVSQLAVEVDTVNKRREAATDQAMTWLRQNRAKHMTREQYTHMGFRGSDVWMHLPDDFEKLLRTEGVYDAVRVQWEAFDVSHDARGRPNEWMRPMLPGESSGRRWTGLPQ